MNESHRENFGPKGFRPRPKTRRPGRGPKGPGGEGVPPADTSWDAVAGWYDKLVGDEGSDYHRNLVLPAAMRLLEPKGGERFLDLCCGQGVFTRLLMELEPPPAYVLAVDASPRLIAAARQRSGAGAGKSVRYEVADARYLGDLADGTFDGAVCLMAVQDLDDVERAFAQMGRALRPGGRAVIVMMHPCFRIPRQSSWEWDEVKKTQFRRLDRYATPMQIPIATHPGSAPGENTTFFHRPLAEYLNALGKAGLAVAACEEPLTHRMTEPGGRSRGENRSRQEFPVFLAMKAVKL